MESTLNLAELQPTWIFDSGGAGTPRGGSDRGRAVVPGQGTGSRVVDQGREALEDVAARSGRGQY